MDRKNLLKSGKIVEYDVLRVFTTILVVVGHCTYLRILTPYGGIDYFPQSAGDPQAVVGKLLVTLVRLIYCFHMPLFVALSGAIFYRKMETQKYSCLRCIVLDKAKRLLVPFLVVTTVYTVPIKLISGYFADSQNPLLDILMGQYLLQGNTHLWFLPTLFVVFVVAFLMEKYCTGDWIKLILCSIAYVVSRLVAVNLISYVLEYLIWFYVGYYFERERPQLNKKIGLGSLMLWLVLFLGAYVLQRMGIGRFTGIKRQAFILVMDFILALTGSYATYQGCFLISDSRDMDSSGFFRYCVQASFAVYLFSDVWNYLVVKVIDDIWGIGIVTGNIGYLSMFMARLVISTVFALLTHSLVERIQITHKRKQLC